MSETQTSLPAVVLKEITLPVTTAELTPQQKGWLKLAAHKDVTFKGLQEKELAVQSLLNKIEENKDLERVQEKLKQAKATAAEGKDQRLQFTNLIKEKLVTAAMAFETRNEALIKTAETHELSLRTKAVEDNDKVSKLSKEESEFKAHFVNENFRIAANFRANLSKLINHYYVTALEKKTPPAKIKEYKDGIVPIIRAAKVEEKPAKFVRVLITQERAAELFKEVTPYNPQNNIEEAVKSIDEKFSMYAQDLQNAQAAIENSKKTLEDTIQKEQQNLTIETHTNNLIASADVVVSGPTIKKEVKAALENSEAYAIKVITASVQHWNAIKKFFKVKKWTNLSIEQLAEALAKLTSETGKPIPGIETIEIKK
jgi:hypothetical protein